MLLGESTDPSSFVPQPAISIAANRDNQDKRVIRDRSETNPIPHGVLVNGANNVAALDRRPVRPEPALKVSHLVLSRFHSSIRSQRRDCGQGSFGASSAPDSLHRQNAKRPHYGTFLFPRFELPFRARPYLFLSIDSRDETEPRNASPASELPSKTLMVMYPRDSHCQSASPSSGAPASSNSS